jgi:hypothetical protein
LLHIYKNPKGGYLLMQLTALLLVKTDHEPQQLTLQGGQKTKHLLITALNNIEQPIIMLFTDLKYLS